MCTDEAPAEPRPSRSSRFGLCVPALPLPEEKPFDVVIRGGTVYDGTGGEPRRADVGIRGDKVEAVGDLSKASAARTIDATGMAVAPGFINMLSWSTESLMIDPRSQSELRQGVTTQIFGEGFSMGPWNDRLKAFMKSQQTDYKYDIPWTTLRDYLEGLQKKGISQNVASYVGATTIRAYVVGFDKRPPTPAELDQMRELVRKEMEAGALGIGSSLIYAPANYASTEELIELCKVAAKYQGKYISHMRSEADTLARGRRRADPDQPRGGPAGGDLPPEGGRRSELAEDGSGDRPRRRGAPAGPEDHRGHVHLHRGRDEPRRVRAAVGARRRAGRDVQTAERAGDAREDRRRDAQARQDVGEPVPPDGFARPGAARRLRARRR